MKHDAGKTPAAHAERVRLYIYCLRHTDIFLGANGTAAWESAQYLPTSWGGYAAQILLFLCGTSFRCTRGITYRNVTYHFC